MSEMTLNQSGKEDEALYCEVVKGTTISLPIPHVISLLLGNWDQSAYRILSLSNSAWTEFPLTAKHLPSEFLLVKEIENQAVGHKAK